MGKKTKNNGHLRGLSLIEAAILIATIGLMVIPAVNLYRVYQWNIKAGTTTQSIATVRGAVDAYYARHNRYPCPASTKLGPDGSFTDPSGVQRSFGQDSAVNPTTGSTTGGNACSGAILGTAEIPSASSLSASNVRVGSVPTRELGLPDSAMLDGWGNRLVYAVTESYAGPQASVPADMSKGGILIKDSRGNPSLGTTSSGTPAALVYFVMAPGPDLRGAYNLEGNMEAPAPTTSSGDFGSSNFNYEACLDTTCTSPSASATFVASTNKIYGAGSSTFTSTFSYMLAAVTNFASSGFHWALGPYGQCNVLCGQSTGTATQQWICVNNQTGARSTDPSVDCAGQTQTGTPGTQSCSATFAWTGSTYNNQCPKTGTTTVSVCKNLSTGAIVDDASCNPSPSCPKPLPTSAPGADTCTYTVISTPGLCTGACGGGAGTQPLTLSCLRSDGTTVGMGYCPAGAPTSQSCTNMATCTGYAWQPDPSWGACTASCGGGTQTRNVICINTATGQQVGNTNCASLAKPAVSQTCNTQACAAGGSCTTTGKIGNIAFLVDDSGSMAYPIVTPAMMSDSTLSALVATRNSDENILTTDELANVPSPYLSKIVTDRLTVANDDTAVRDRLAALGLATPQNSRIAAAKSVLDQVVPQIIQEKAAYDPTHIVGVLPIEFTKPINAPSLYLGYSSSIANGTKTATAQDQLNAIAPTMTSIDSYVASGGTPLLYNLMKLADSIGNGTATQHNAIVVISDGVDNASGLSMADAVAYIAGKYPYLDLNIVDVNGNQVLSKLVNTSWTISAAQAAAAKNCSPFASNQGFKCPGSLSISAGNYMINGTYVNVTDTSALAGALLAASSSCSAPPVNYIWDVSAWGACSSNCGPGGQSRVVTCTDASGNVVPTTDCPQPEPVLAESCDLIDCASSSNPNPTGNAGTSVCDPTLLGANPTIWSATQNLSAQDLSYANMPEANLVSYNLTNSVFFDATLKSANFQGATVTNTDFTGADLDCANLSGLNLTGVSFGPADLSYANLQNTNLSGVDLSQTILSNADLTGANLTGANLNGAVMTNTVVTAAQLATAAAPPPPSPAPSAAIFQNATNPINAQAGWTVPTGVTSITARVWASGGGGGCGSSADQQGNGGGSGYTQADIAVTPGETLYTFTLPGGASSSASGTGGCQWSAADGGPAAWVRDANGVMYVAGGVNIIAGGGGGGGGGNGNVNFDGGNGGPGSGAIGINGNGGNDPYQSCCNTSGYGGYGSTTTAVGNGGEFGQPFAGGNGINETGGSGMGCTGAGPAWKLTTSSSSTWRFYGGTGGSGSSSYCGGGGGGGGGYYGAGGGAGTDTSLATGGGGGGGGGSGIAIGTGVTNIITATGSGLNAANMSDPYYIGGTGMGAAGSTTAAPGPTAGGPATVILTYTCGTPPCIPATDPQAFQFTNQTGVPMASLITSNTVTLAGGFTNATALCSYNTSCNGMSINGGPFTQGTVTPVNSGDTIAIQTKSASEPNATTVASVFVGATQSLLWQVTTTTTPTINPITFTNQPSVATGTTIASNAVTLTGGLTGQTVTCGAGCTGISINGGAWTAGPTTASDGDTIAIEQTSSASPSTPTTATVTVGPTTSAAWTVTTNGGTVNAFSFTAITNVPPSTLETSNAVALAGAFANATAACNAGCSGISINGGAFVAGPVTGINPGNTIAIQSTSSAAGMTTTTPSVTVGTTTGSWSISTGAQVNAFSFTNVTGQTTSSTITSNTVTLSGTFTNQIATCGAGCTDIIIGGVDCSCTTTTASVSSGNTIAIKQLSSASGMTATKVTVTVGPTTSSFWEVVTGTGTVNAFSFTNQTGVSTNSMIPSNAVALGGGFANATATCGAGCTGISINGASFVAGPVTGVNSGDTISITQMSSSSANTATTATVTVGSTTSGAWSVTTGAGGSTVNAFSFNNEINVQIGAYASSNTVTLTGGFTNATATCGAGCAGISINGAGFLPGPVTGVNSGDTISIEQFSSSSPSTATTATVTVGATISGAWTVTTGASGSQTGTVSAFSFTNQTGVPLKSLITSNTVTLSGGFTNATASCIMGCGSISINGRAFAPSTFINVNSGDTIAVQQTSSASANTATTVTVSVGGVSSTWQVTTGAGGSGTVNPFSFNNEINVPIAVGVVSNTVTLTGGFTNATATCGGNCSGISINGGAFAAGPVTGVNSGDTIALSQPTSTSPSTATTATVTVGATVSGAWTVTTGTSGALSGTVSAFNFPNLTGVATNTTITSNRVRVGAGFTNATVTCGAGCTGISINGSAFAPGPFINVSSGAAIAIEQTSSASANTATTATVTVGNASTTWSVTTGAGPTINPFSFADRYNAPLNTTVYSNPIVLSGGATGQTASCSAAGCCISVNGAACTSGNKTVNSGDTVYIGLPSSASASTAVTAQLTVGATSTIWTVTTGAAGSTVNAFGFANVVNAPLSSSITSDTVTLTGGFSNATATCGAGCSAISINGGAFVMTTIIPGVGGQPSVVVPATVTGVNSGDTITIQQTSSGAANTTSTASVTVGTTTGTFAVKTGTGAAPDIYVGVDASTSVAAVNPGTGTIDATISTGSSSVQKIVHANGYEYALGSNIYVIDPSTNTLSSTITTGGCDIDISPTGAVAYVPSLGGIISVIDLSTNTITSTINTGVGGMGCTVGIFDSTGTYYYILGESGGAVAKIATATGAVIGTVIVGTMPEIARITPDGSKMYVLNVNSSNVSVINLSTFTLSSTITTGSSPEGAEFDPTGAYLYVANHGAGSVSVITTSNDLVARTITGFTSPVQVMTGAGYTYVVETGAFGVGVFENGFYDFPTTVGSSPTHLAINSAGTAVYVTNNGSGTVSVINSSTTAVTSTLNLGATSQPDAIDAP